MKVTLSVIKADIGGYVGHSESHPDILAKAEEYMAKAKKDGLLIDYRVTKCGDDLQLIMTHLRVRRTRRFISWPGIPLLPVPRWLSP